VTARLPTSFGGKNYHTLLSDQLARFVGHETVRAAICMGLGLGVNIYIEPFAQFKLALYQLQLYIFVLSVEKKLPDFLSDVPMN
jgi:hypothetical protein